MKSHRVIKILCVIAAGIAALLFAGCTGASAQGDPDSDYGVEILTCGPVHEAFAEPVTYNAAQGIVVAVRPSEAIEETPPEDMPEGEDVTWIPGYWSWDQDRDDFIWVSGIWRDPPPGRSWVPGYWASADEGWIWTAGFWTDAESEDVEYLPQPPESLEVGPSSPAPGADRFWTPGCWRWNEPRSRYAWQSGYWISASPDWVWQPAHYVWTRRGYVYVEGYWDRTFERRGVLFAPMYVQRSVRTRQDYSYSPLIVIQIGSLLSALFDSPDSHHYYFGDYYGDEYSRRGFHPWFEIDRHHRGYDPVYAHQRWQHERTDDNWDRRMREDYDFRRRHIDARPARTYAAQARVVARAPERERKNLVFGVSLSDFSGRRDAPIRFQKIDSARRESLNTRTKELVRFRNDRVKWEIRDEKAGDKGEYAKDRARDSGDQRRLLREPGKPNLRNLLPDKPQRVKIPKSPIFGRRSSATGRGENPPDRPDAIKFEPNNRSKSTDKDKSERESMDKDKSKRESMDKENSKRESMNKANERKAAEKDKSKRETMDNEKSNREAVNRANKREAAAEKTSQRESMNEENAIRETVNKEAKREAAAKEKVLRDNAERDNSRRDATDKENSKRESIDKKNSKRESLDKRGSPNEAPVPDATATPEDKNKSKHESVDRNGAPNEVTVRDNAATPDDKNRGPKDERGRKNRDR